MLLIVNRTANSFFVYRHADDGYKQILKKLCASPDNDVDSHWNKKDTIVILPDATITLYNYVSKIQNYNQLIFTDDIDTFCEYENKSRATSNVF